LKEICQYSLTDNYLVITVANFFFCKQTWPHIWFAFYTLHWKLKLI